MPAPYKLSATLSGHSQDVRAVASTSSGIILSSSRDSTARSWSFTSKSKSWSPMGIYAGHENYVGAVVSAKLQDGSEVVVTGSNDSTIMVWSSTTEGTTRDPNRMLIGHASNVCTLDSRDGLLASGSWDTTAKIWDLNDPSDGNKWTLQGSELSIWAVKLLPSPSENTILTLTGSADKLIRLYSNSSLIQTFKGHTQPVRALCVLPDSTGKNIFASAGNDGQIKIWNWKEGHLVRTLDGHESFVYSLACTLDGTLISSGEDRSVRIYSKENGEILQILTIPAISVWAVSVMQGTSDIIVGSSDAQVRLFTTDVEKQATASELLEYDTSVSSSAINTTQVGDVKKSDLPGAEDLDNRIGKKEGEIAMVKTVGGDVEAYQWTSAERKWVKVGQVVDAVGSGRKQLYKGKEYDYVFDVDVAEGQPPLKLPFNVIQNPYEAAQLFLNANELPQSYIDQVVQFIEKNTEGTTLGGQGGMDPYTGASSYRGGNDTGRNSAMPQNGFSGDPWGGGTSSSARQRVATSSLLPHNSFLNFSQANVSAIQKKIFDLNQKLSEEPTTATEFSMDSADVTTLQAMVSSLSSSPSSFTLDHASGTILAKLLDWPASSRFPVLDLVRVVSLHAPLSQFIFQLLSNLTPNPASSTKENETNSMLALRGVANMFGKGKQGMQDNSAEILETLVLVGTEGLNKNGQTALATVALNYSILASEGNLNAASVIHLLDLIESLLQGPDAETLYRSLVAFGNIVFAPTKDSIRQKSGKLQSIFEQADRLAKDGEQRVKDVLREIGKKGIPS